jgi:NhaP-type Na+/H+ or K+/H+ antiporter
MFALTTETFTAMLALIGAVIIIAALLSGAIERSNLPQVAVFLALGAVLGPPGLGMLNITLDSPVLRVVATLSLALVLFTDAVRLNIKEVRRHWKLAALVLGPGTFLSAGLVTLAGWWLLGLPLAAAAIVGAALASTDPVLLRGFLRRRDVPSATLQALRLESGLNDAVLLPVVLVAMVFLGETHSSGSEDWGRLALNMLLLGPGAGIAVGMLGVATLDMVRRRVGVRRDYESLYSLGVAFAAFAAAEAVHGSGFLAAFTAGLTIAALDVEMCDCFLEYGETTAEMALLFTFVLFGSSLIWSGFGLFSLPVLLFAVLALLIRPVAFLISLLPTRLALRDRLLISWFGPRGLSTLLLVLLPVFAGLPGSDRLFAICSLVVLFSVVLHGGSLMTLRRSGLRPAREQDVERDARSGEEDFLPLQPTQELPATRRTASEGADGHLADNTIASSSERITLTEIEQLRGAGEQVIILDARTTRTFEESGLLASGAVRLHPDHAVQEATKLNLPRDAWLVAFCA